MVLRVPSPVPSKEAASIEGGSFEGGNLEDGGTCEGGGLEGAAASKGTIEQPNLGLRVLLWESPAAGLSTYPAHPSRGLVNL